MRDWPLWEVFVRSRRGLCHVHVGSLHAPDAEMALRNARDLYTRRQEGVSLWVVPASRSPRPARRGRARSSTPPATRSTATRRSTTCPRESSTCEHPTDFFVSPASLRRRTTPRGPRSPRLDLATQCPGGVRARARRRRPRLRTADGEGDPPRAQDRGGGRARKNRLDPAGQARSLLTYA